jgi:YgiT-type zinc finger domain-containing protein
MANKKTPEVCPVCGGTLSEQLVTHTEQDEQGHFYIYENVPAQVCEACGEYLLSDETVSKMDRLVDKAKPDRKIEAPVYDLVRA